MTPPYNLSEDPFKQLKDKIRLRLKEDMIDEKIFDLVKGAYLELLHQENIILSRTEQNRLLHGILRDTLNDMLTGL